tara:strand:- start:218 stop:436 length:219 start_codon:yes stop_codon:yes gene_type:complete
MDQKTFLKEMAKHAQRNSDPVRREDSNQKKIQIKMFKKESEDDKLFKSISLDSLELYAQMMRDRYGDNDIDE